MPLFRVMCYRDGVWDLLEPRVVEANNARQAAEKVCGGVVVEGADRRSSVYLKVWPLLPTVEWFSLPVADCQIGNDRSEAAITVPTPTTTAAMQ